jgi:hypothetical protein
MEYASDQAEARSKHQMGAIPTPLRTFDVRQAIHKTTKSWHIYC